MRDLPEWDSLAALGVIVMFDLEYKKPSPATTWKSGHCGRSLRAGGVSENGYVYAQLCAFCRDGNLCKRVVSNLIDCKPQVLNVSVWCAISVSKTRRLAHLAVFLGPGFRGHRETPAYPGLAARRNRCADRRDPDPGLPGALDSNHFAGPSRGCRPAPLPSTSTWAVPPTRLACTCCLDDRQRCGHQRPVVGRRQSRQPG